MPSKKAYELSIDPRILELLGPNLYTNIYYVLAELIANAYDADAENVYISVDGSTITVEDDGKGMSYARGEVAAYLNVATVSRTSSEDSTTPRGRLKMGRKGVGKLAALSVSETVDVMTVSAGEKSGFKLTRRPTSKLLDGIPEDAITFAHATDHGTAIVMRDSQYSLPKTPETIAKNLVKLFPVVGPEFRLHIRVDDREVTVASFDTSVMKELSALITLGEQFREYSDQVPIKFPSHHSELVESRPTYTTNVTVTNSEGSAEECELEVQGWIGAYVSTANRKAVASDFPDNFISLFANGKMGEFNILPVVGQNKLNEVYVVGQLHIDLFERTDLPDMALSNRQGYKTDDPRYVTVIEYVRNELLPDILRRRGRYASLAQNDRERRKLDEQRMREEALRESVDKFREAAATSAAEAVVRLVPNASGDGVRASIRDALNEHAPDLGLKAVIDSQKKKILISHTSRDKDLADVVYDMLKFNGVAPDDVLYSNSEDGASRVPEGVDIYEYLREFFVESYSTQKMLVLFITSKDAAQSWGAVVEVGATWIVQLGHKIFNIGDFRPEPPLDNASQWQTTQRDANTGDIWMTPVDADIFCEKIEAACRKVGVKPQRRLDNMTHLRRLVEVRT